MKREEEIREAALNHRKGFRTSDDSSVIGAFGNGMHSQSFKSFTVGAEWADEHPQKANGCDFCNKSAGINHKSDECYLSYNDGILTVDVDMPLTWGSATGYYGFDINYCPFCGRKLK